MLEIESSPLAGRPAHHRSRVVAIAAAVSLATAALGFVAGRAAAPEASRAAVTPVTTAAEPGRTAPEEPGGATAGTEAPMATDLATSDAASDAASNAPTDDSGSIPVGMGGGQYAMGAYEDAPRELLAERVTADGVTMRAHVTRYEGQPFPGGGDGWTPAGWCYPAGDMRVSIVAPDSANLGWASWYTEPKEGLSVTTFSSGYVEGRPRFGVVAQVPIDAATVTFTTASGLTDSTAPTNGIALLTVVGPIEQDFTVSVQSSGGAITTKNVAELTDVWGSADYREACEPPPPVLPPAGEQPDAPAAAEAAIRESWRIAHDFANTEPEARSTYVDDETGLAEAWDALQSGEYGATARTSTTTIRELVFTGPTEAWFRYDIETSIIDFPNRYGIARLGDDGVWRITRQTICQDIALAPGYRCTPTVGTLYPPGAADDLRYSSVPIDETAATLGE